MYTFHEDHHLVCVECGMVVPALVNGSQCAPCRSLERAHEDREIPPDDGEDDDEPPWETCWGAVPRLTDR